MSNETRLAGLREALPKLSGKDAEFAQSLLTQAGLRGLSDKQWPWVDKLRDRALTPPPASRQIGSFQGVVALLDKAAEKLKRFALRFRAGDIEYRLTVAGAMSKSPGSINVTMATPDDAGQREWFGRVTRDGAFQPSPRLDAATAAMITGALEFVSKDPAGAARLYGRETGECCFCGLELTDKRSIEAGYGPICAEKWGLPWG